MGSLNKVQVIGNLGADVELRYTQGQVPVSNFSVAATEVWVDNQGQKQERTEWVRVIVWQKLAENCAKYLAKGRQVYVEGKMQTRKYTDKQGVERYTTEVVASNVVFLGGNPEGKGGQAQGQKPGQQAAAPQQDSGAPPNLDDIPFNRRLDQA